MSTTLPLFDRPIPNGNHVPPEYHDCLIDFGRRHADFIAGEVTEVYEKKHGKLSTHEQKALGGLYIRLQNVGVIEKTGAYRQRNQGNVSAVYRLK